MSFKITLQKLATQKNISPTELSRETGISKSVLHRFFTEETANPTLDTLSRLSAFFEIGIDQLIGRIETEKKDVRVPIIDWADVAAWPSDTVTAIKHVNVTIDDKSFFSKTSFGLVLNEFSMEPIFTLGTILIFNPTLALKDRSFILYLNKDETIPCFKQLIKNGYTKLVKSLNPEISNRIEELKDDTVILGVLVASINSNLY